MQEYVLSQRLVLQCYAREKLHLNLLSFPTNIENISEVKKNTLYAAGEKNLKFYLHISMSRSGVVTKRSNPTPEVRGSGWEEQPHVQRVGGGGPRRAAPRSQSGGAAVRG